MQFKQFYLGCLSHASYYIGSNGEAAIIDPQRDVQQYLDEAAAHGQAIKYVIETHSHADFVSGHVELAAKTGAQIVYGQRAKTQFPTLKVKDGDELAIGSIKLKFLETPGHTPEGITIIAEEEGSSLKMFTGDTLFIGDVGRPDLVGSKGFTAEEMGEMLYDSLRDKILPLPDETEVYPAHGAGSLCGKSLSKETWSTLGEQRRFNYALQPMTKEEFVKIVASDQPEVPMYFPRSAAKNLEGSAPLDEVAKPRVLTTDDVFGFDGVVVDVRSNSEYGAGHVPNSINISGIQRVLQTLLSERVSIRDLSTILEGIADAIPFSRNPQIIAEHVRARLSRQICAQFTTSSGYLPLVALSAQWEQAFAESIIGQGDERSLAMQPSRLSEFIIAVRERFEDAAREGEAPVLVTSPSARPFVRGIIERFRAQTSVMSQSEIHPRVRLKTVGSI